MNGVRATVSAGDPYVTYHHDTGGNTNYYYNEEDYDEARFQSISSSESNSDSDARDGVQEQDPTIPEGTSDKLRRLRDAIDDDDDKNNEIESDKAEKDARRREITKEIKSVLFYSLTVFMALISIASGWFWVFLFVTCFLIAYNRDFIWAALHGIRYRDIQDVTMLHLGSNKPDMITAFQKADARFKIAMGRLFTFFMGPPAKTFRNSKDKNEKK
jgi:hypothetical protein